MSCTLTIPIWSSSVTLSFSIKTTFALTGGRREKDLIFSKSISFISWLSCSALHPIKSTYTLLPTQPAISKWQMEILAAFCVKLKWVKINWTKRAIFVPKGEFSHVTKRNEISDKWFNVRYFRGKKISRFEKTAKFLHFRGI